MNFADLGLELQVKENEAKIGDNLVFTVKNYLPINDKAKFIEYVALNALDDSTGCFSPLRVELYFALALCQFYAGLEFGEGNSAEIYDVLDTNGIIDVIRGAIPYDEVNFLQNLTEETIEDMSRYNSSAAGIIQGMGANASSLDGQITEILDKIKNAEGLELLSEIKNVVGAETADKQHIVVRKG